MILAGFGNLRGNVEVWDVKGRRQVSKSQAADSTLLSWCGDGEHYLTATTSPRLRVANGYKLWHYTSSLQHEMLCRENEELWDVQWQPCPPGAFKAKPISYQLVPGIQSSQPQASKEAYRPPCARGQAPSFKVKDEEPSNNDPAKSKSALKNQKRKEAKKAKKENNPGGDSSDRITTPLQKAADTPVESSDVVPKEKKIRNIKKAG